MLTKLGCYIKELFCDIKRKITCNKLIFYSALGALILGILIAISKNYTDYTETNNFIFVVLNVNTSPVPQILRIVLWLPLVYLCLLLASMHFISFITIGLGGIMLGSYCLMKNALIAINVDPTTGIVYLLTYIVPTVIITFICVICVMQEINLLMDFPRNHRHVTSLNCNARALKNIFKPYFIANIAILLVYWLILYLILLLFC